MPLYRLGNDGNWKKIVSMFRLGNDGIWKKIVAMYRLGNDGIWKKILSSLIDAPVATTVPTLRNATNVDPTTTVNSSLFFGGDTIYLTRGAYTNTTSNTNTKYTMTIYKSSNYSSDIDNWTAVTGPTIYYGNNSTTNTSITYPVTDADGRGKYYFAGRVAVNNDANTAGSTNTNFDIKNSNNLAKISATVTGYQSFGATSNGSQFSFTIGGITAGVSTDIYDIIIDILNPSDHPTSPNTVIVTKDDIGLVYGYITTSIFNNLIQPNTTNYQARLKVIFNDGWATSNYPTQIVQTINFNTLGLSPVNIIAPEITPLNNRFYVPVNTQLTCSAGSWTNSPTSYSYSWQYDNGNNQLPPDDRWNAIPGSTNSNTYIPPSNYTSLYNNKIRCVVIATNASGSNEAITSQYAVDAEVTISAISPTSVTAGQSRNFAFTVSGYPTSYVIDWTNDGVTDYTSPTISSGTSSVNASVANTYSSGTSTLKVTAQPGNKQRTATITAVNQPTASSITKSDGTVTPSQPSTITFSSSNNQVTSSWTNGSPVTSVTFKGLGAGVNTEYTDSSSPFITSDVSNFSSTGTYTATVTNINNSLAVNISWNQSNAASYQINYSSSIFGADVAIGNSSDSSVTVSIPWNSNMGTFTLSGITVYSGANQTGLSTDYPNPSPGGLIPSQKSSSRSNNVSLTYSVQAPTNTSAPTLTGTAQVGQTLTFGVGTWSGSPTSYDLELYRGTQFVARTETLLKDAGNVTSSTYVVTQADFNSFQDYIRVFAKATNAGGASDWVGGTELGPITAAPVTQYTVTWNANGGSVSPTSSTFDAGGSVTTPTPTRSGYTFVAWRDTPSLDYTYTTGAGVSWFPPSQNITMYARWTASGTAPATPTNGSGTYATGTNYVTNATFTSSASGTTPITYSWTVSSSTSSSGPWSFQNSGSISSSSLSTTLSIPQQSWNQATYGNWAQYTVTASNGTPPDSGTLTWLI